LSFRRFVVLVFSFLLIFLPSCNGRFAPSHRERKTEMCVALTDKAVPLLQFLFPIAIGTKPPPFAP
jgi:hypothetical protein